MEERKESKLGSAELGEANRRFQSVWQRVMREGADSPIVVDDEAPAPVAQTEGTALATRPATTSIATLPKTAVADCTADFPTKGDTPFFGNSDADLLGLLQELQLREVHSARLYRALGRRVGGGAAQVLATMSMEDMRAAKRLGAACFLISGVQLHMPEERVEPFNSYLGTLRTRFMEEQHSAAGYTAAAAESRDPWLCHLLTDLCEEKLRHAGQLRMLVEKACQ